MRTLAIDIETYSSVSLIDSGVYAYSESSDFEILLFGYAFDDDDVTVIDLAQGEKLPEAVLTALTDKQILKTAFNANFERTCLSRWLNRYLEPTDWSCTAVMAKELGLPNTLADVGEVIGLAENEQKLKIGKALIRYFSLPCKPTGANGFRSRNLPYDDFEKWDLYKEYNAQDVAVERRIRKKLKKYEIAASEKDLWNLDQRINDRGVLADIDFAAKAVTFDQKIKTDLKEQAIQLTGLDNPKSTIQIKQWILNETNVVVESLERKKIPEIKRQLNNEKVNRVLDIREGLSKTSTEKYTAMLRTACSDKRIRGLTQFYGAGRTGRWAGRLVQMQNLPQNKIPDDELDAARKLVKSESYDSLEMIFDKPANILSQLIRTAFIPKPGCKFIVSDFSAIEARVIAWLADEKWRLDVFNTHGKIYEASAEQMFKLPAGSVKKGDPMRTKGKIAELALGYGGSSGALIAMGALNSGLTETDLLPLVNSWRAANPAITKFWWKIDAALKQVIRSKSVINLPKGLAMRMEGPLLRLKLPSGRELSYIRPRLSAGTGPYGHDEITYEGLIQSTNTWGRISTYGPKMVENIVQATARDCLAESMKRLEKLGFPVVFHVHDEVILEVPFDKTAAEVAAIMGKPISWAPGLPLKADAYECEYYRKD